jgi:signal transduction histidine kinase
MEDSWDWVEEEIKKMQDDLPQDPEAMQVVDAISVADFWKRRYDEERMLWERKLDEKEGERSELTNKAVNHESSIKELDFKFKELERRWEQEKLLLEDRIKAKEVEATVAQARLEWEKRMKSLEEENQRLKIQLNNLEGIPLSPRQKLAQEREQPLDQGPARGASQERACSEDHQRELEASKKQLEALEKDKIRVAKEIEEKEKSFQMEKELWSKLETEIKAMSQNMTTRLNNLKERESEHFFMLEDLARGFAHRIRNFLGIISGTVQLSMSNFKLEPELKEQLTTVEQNVAEMLKSIEEFLVLSKVPQMDVQPANVKKIVDDALSGFAEKIRSQKIAVSSEFTPPDIMVKCDAKLLREALKDIIENSIDAMIQGGRLDINASLDRENNLLFIKIIDTGIGVSEMHLKKIAQPYFSTKPNRKGLGLTMAKRVIDLHKGSLTVASEKGKGMTVSISLYQEAGE